MVNIENKLASELGQGISDFYDGVFLERAGDNLTFGIDEHYEVEPVKWWSKYTDSISRFIINTRIRLAEWIGGEYLHYEDDYDY